MGVAEGILSGTANLPNEERKHKLIIHETDYHGCGKVYYKGNCDYYSYDDESGDVAAAVRFLINIGFIKEEDVMMYDGDEIYVDVDSFLESKN